jgi:hypothetical protein
MTYKTSIFTPELAVHSALQAIYRGAIDFSEHQRTHPSTVKHQKQQPDNYEVTPQCIYLWTKRPIEAI